MKKQTSTLAIIIAIIMSIFLFPLIVGTGIASGTIFSVESVIQPGREQELYEVFETYGGTDWIYELFLEETGEQIVVEEDLIINVRELYPKEDVSTVIKGIYQSLLKGEEYSLDLSKQEQFIREEFIRYFDDNAEKWLREELGEAYDVTEEALKKEIIETARESFKQEIDSLVMKEIEALEVELTEIVQDVYESEEYKELRKLEEEYGYSLTDRTELCAVLNLAGYIVLGICCFFLLLLLICHLFRPSGFITAGVSALITGGMMKFGGTVLLGVMGGLLRSEIAAEEELPEFFVQLAEEVFSWFLAGFDKVGMLGLGTGIILVLVGILLMVIRGNRQTVQ